MKQVNVLDLLRLNKGTPCRRFRFAVITVNIKYLYFNVNKKKL